MSLNMRDDAETMSEINMTPLVDVMLVLLVIFIITLPVIQGAIKVDLPHTQSRANDQQPAHIKLAIAADGTLSWNQERIDEATLIARLKTEASRQPQPELHLYADRQTAYEKLAQVMAHAQQNGLSKIGFITAQSTPTQQMETSR